MSNKQKTPTWLAVQAKLNENEAPVSRSVTESDIMDICMKYRHYHGAKEHARRDLVDILYKLAAYYQK